MVFAPIRTFIAQAPADARPALTIYYETCLQGPCLEGGANLSDVRDDPRLASVAIDRIARAPLGFASLALGHYESLWSPYRLLIPRRPMR